MISVVCVNQSTVLNDAQVQACVDGLQKQVDEHFFPAWGIEAQLSVRDKSMPITLGEWELVFADNSDQIGALGYHETTANGDPIGYVFAKDDLDSGTSWTVTASHELLEMLADPDIQTVEEQDNAGGSITFRMKEVCDPCEDDSLAYDIARNETALKLPDGSPILVSDFVFPEYFNQNAPAGAKLDFCGKISKPLQILSGGYMGVLQVPATSKWTQIQADLTPGGKPIHDLSRRSRRLTPDHKWRRSER